MGASAVINKEGGDNRSSSMAYDNDLDEFVLMMGFTNDSPENEVKRLYNEFRVTPITPIRLYPNTNNLTWPLVNVLFYRQQFITLLEILKHDISSAPIIRKNIEDIIITTNNGNQYVSGASEHQLISLGTVFAMVDISLEQMSCFCENDITCTYMVPLAFGFVKEKYVGWHQLGKFVELIYYPLHMTPSHVSNVDGYMKALALTIKPSIENLPVALCCFGNIAEDAISFMMRYILPVIRSNKVFTTQLVLSLGDMLDALIRAEILRTELISTELISTNLGQEREMISTNLGQEGEIISTNLGQGEIISTNLVQGEIISTNLRQERELLSTNLGLIGRFKYFTQTEQQRANTSFESFLLVVSLEQQWQQKNWKKLSRMSLSNYNTIGDYYEYVFLCMTRFGVHNDIQRLILPFISLDVLV